MQRRTRGILVKGHKRITAGNQVFHVDFTPYVFHGDNSLFRLDQRKGDSTIRAVLVHSRSFQMLTPTTRCFSTFRRTVRLIHHNMNYVL